MARHGFGIMKAPPGKGRRYDRYEPEKYNCIFADDDYIENIITEFCHIDTFWHTTEVKGKGLDYCGITLIPPESLNEIADIIRDIHGLEELLKLIQEALKENKWIIHFGL